MEKLILKKKKSADGTHQKHEKLPSMQRVIGCFTLYTLLKIFKGTPDNFPEVIMLTPFQ